ncbi:MAG: acyl-CoA reductase, partial [Flavisolibacter sp.]
MKLQQRKAVLVRLGQYMNGDSEEWELAKHRAFLNNNWFIPEFIDLSVQNIASGFLNETALEHLAKDYSIPEENPAPRKIGLVMAGNIPLVGFHDLICVFLSGNYAWIKPSSKDEVLIKHLVAKMIEWAPDTSTYLVISGLLKNCDAYIATGSNNASRYFEYYFRNY